MKKRQGPTGPGKTSPPLQPTRANLEQPERFYKKLILPEIAFLFIGTAFGIVFLFVTPPFGVPDEQVHFYRAYQVSELGIFGTERFNPQTAFNEALLPKSLWAITDSVELERIKFNPYNKIRIDKIISLLSLPLDTRSRQFLPIAPYSPITYLPQAVAIAIGRLFSLSPVLLLYLARIFALTVWLYVMYLSIKSTPILKWAFFLLALMPMTVFLAPSSSADSVILATCFLVIAVFLRCSYDDTKNTVRRKDVYLLFSLLLVLILSKPVYFLVVFLFFLIPYRKFGTKREYYLTFITIFLSGIVIYFLWGKVSSYPLQATKLAVLSDPSGFLDVLHNTAAKLGKTYLNTFVGQLGWLDAYLPSWLIYSYLLLLIAVSLSGKNTVNLPIKAKLLSIGIFSVVVFLIFDFSYRSWNEPGGPFVYGVQGRYFIPVAPLFFLVCYSRKISLVKTEIFRAAVLLFSVLSLAIAAYAVVDRFYVESPPPFEFERIAMNTTRDSLLIQGWAIDYKSADPPKGILLELAGKLYQPRYGIERNDLVARYKIDSYRYSGFETRIPFSQVGLGRHLLALKFVPRDGGPYDVLVQTITLGVK